MSKIEYSADFEKKLEEFIQTKEFKDSECFRIPKVRDLLVLDRFKNIYQSELKTISSDSITGQTILHNSSLERMFYSEMSARPDLISKPLSCMNTVMMNAHKMKVLSVGCRTEAEIFSLVDAGFEVKNITGIDLFSYTPLIELGDVCDLAYPSETFDIVICGWVLEFVTEIEKAVLEIKRVTKPGGFIAIGGMHHPISVDLEKYNKRKKHEDRKWYASVDNIIKTFKVSNRDCVFKSEIAVADIDKRGEVVVIFKRI
jgi:SAM-dependent methyltransferase